ncbi:hypothetical protein Zmor_006138 [Zophobas morio]|uniref:PAZ domain-containing protein n=1 Tax=Zophobas morio TaxID=2755281 RepID=A0AA38IPK2_9CUCU|nr:hypothetical protein Zmor_006138 [Zophobas morio]
MKKHKETKVGVGGGEPAEELPPKSRRRAALLQKIQEMKEKNVGAGDEAKSQVTKPGASSASTSRDVDRLSTAVSKLSIATSSEPVSFKGAIGTPIRATANYIFLKVEKDRGVFEYEVRFQPEIDAKSYRMKLVAQALEEQGATRAYYGDVFFYNYFSPDHKQIVPQHKLEVLPGFVVHVDEMEGGLMLCLDTQHKVIRSQTVYELMGEIHSAVGGDRSYKGKVRDNVVGSCVLTKYNNKTYTVDDVVFDTCPRSVFHASDGQRSLALRTYLERVKQSEEAQNVLAGWGLILANGTGDLDVRVIPQEAIYFGGPQAEERKYVGGSD